MKKMALLLITIILISLLCLQGCLGFGSKPYLFPSEVVEKQQKEEYKTGDAVKVIYGYAEIVDAGLTNLIVVALYDNQEDLSKPPLYAYILKLDPLGTEGLVSQYCLSATFGVTLVFESFTEEYQHWEIVRYWNPSMYGV